MRIAALIVAAGRGTRLGGDAPKQYQEIDGRSVLRRSIEALLAHPGVTFVLTVIHAEDAALYAASAAGLAADRVLPPVTGASTRSGSVRRGLEALETHGIDAVLIHDAARPFLPFDVTERVIAALADGADAVCPGIPVVDALWRAEDGEADAPVDRTGLWRAQTPQGFAFAAILAAHRATEADLADDVAAARAAGLSVRMVHGARENYKITTPEDLERARRETGGHMDIRTGNGFDVHAFGDGDHVTLCGVPLPFERGLSGHSDADVGMHALTDAIFGALGRRRHRPVVSAVGSAMEGRRVRDFSSQGDGARRRARFLRDPSRLHADLRGSEDRTACGDDARAPRRDHRHRRGPDQREGHHLRAAGLHRPGRRHRGARHRDAGAGMTRLIATFCYVGLIRPAPGTWGSLAALPLAWLLHWAGGFPLLLVASVAVFALGYWATKVETAAGGDPDPSEIVIDEVVGQWIALFPLSAGLWFAGAAPHVFPWPGWVGGFLLFRLFDIWKPWPVSWADGLHGPMGVMLDDVLAGIMAAICVAAAAAFAHGVLM